LSFAAGTDGPGGPRRFRLRRSRNSIGDPHDDGGAASVESADVMPVASSWLSFTGVRATLVTLGVVAERCRRSPGASPRTVRLRMAAILHWRSTARTTVC
jgi:hypothetical protein